MKQLYNIFSNEKVSTVWTQLTWSHLRLLFSLETDSMNYYIKDTINKNLSVRELEFKIKSNEYERLPIETKNKLILDDEIETTDLVPNPILIRNKNNIDIATEKALHNLILEDIESFMKELGNSFAFMSSEYKIKIGDRNHYIDLLLFNVKFNCYVVTELKVTEFKVEYISQVQKYMNYIDKHIKEISTGWCYMKIEELKELKEKVEQLIKKRNEVLEIQEEIKKLEETDEIKKYLNLLNLFKEKTTGRNTGIEKFTNKKIIDIAVSNTTITPDEEMYVYIGTYKYNNEIDIVHGSCDILVSRNDHKANYVLYQNLEAKYYETVQIPYTKADEFESTHKIIFPQNVANKQRYFYDLQSEYFETMVFESPEKAKEKVNRLIRK